MTLPEQDPVERQLRAYNARDLESFLACYTDDVVLLKDGAELMAGKTAMRERYGKLFAENPDLLCVVVRRETGEGTVTDDEVVTGIPSGELRARVRYEVAGGLIRRVDISISPRP